MTKLLNLRVGTSHPTQVPSARPALAARNEKEEPHTAPNSAGLESPSRSGPKSRKGLIAVNNTHVRVVGSTPHGVPSEGMWNVRLWSDTRRGGACGPSRLRFAVVLAAAVAGLAIVGHCVPARPTTLPFSSSSLPSVSPGPAFSARADQPNLGQVLPLCKASKVLAIDAIPKSMITALALFGLGLAALVAKGWLAQLVAPAGRSPPNARVPRLAGQELLTRFCIARR